MNAGSCRNASSFCYAIQVANAPVARATVHAMNSLKLSAHRISRLVAAVDKVCGGNKTEFARRLGYKDGAFVRQMVSGARPVSEKTIRAIEALPGMRGWFDVGSGEVVPHPKAKAVPSDVEARYNAASPAARALVDLILLRSDEKWPAWASPPMHSVLTAALEVAASLTGGHRKSG